MARVVALQHAEAVMRMPSGTLIAFQAEEIDGYWVGVTQTNDRDALKFFLARPSLFKVEGLTDTERAKLIEETVRKRVAELSAHEQALQARLSDSAYARAAARS